MHEEKTERQRAPMISATGLWKNRDKNGNMFLSGNMGMVAVFIFPNRDKKSDNEPDHYLMFAAGKKREPREESKADKYYNSQRDEDLVGSDEELVF